MEEYIKEAPRVVTVPSEPLLQLTYRPEEFLAVEENKESEEQVPSETIDNNVVVPNSEPAPHPPPSHNNFDTGDLLGLNDLEPNASYIEERNVLALAIVPNENGTTSTFNSSAAQTNDFDPTGWELALVSTPSTDISAVNERQLAGGLDSLTLNSLYDEAAYRAAQQPVYGAPAPNPFEVHDPFSISSSVPPPAAVQMAAMQHQANPFGAYQQLQPQPLLQPQQQQHVLMDPANPFADSGFGGFHANPVSHPQNNNPFGSTGLL